ncbi:MAG: ABC transporter permease subunit [Saprospiraceae bacterium]|nr:ABC transporter permease subunit [Saprospiraceae bacterium]
MWKLSKYIISDIVRNKVILLYGIFQFLAGMLLFNLDENPDKALMSLLNIELIILPLISMIFATIHYYNSYEFMEMLLAQPLGRKQLIISEYFATSLSLIIAFLLGLGIPVLLYYPSYLSLMFMITGCGLTMACTSLAFLTAVLSRDKARGIGAVLMIWFYFALVYDGIVLMILFSFSDYPLEKITLLLTALNPIDLARVSMMLQMDVSALMGYTGALFKEFFGSIYGIAFTGGIMVLWIVLTLVLAVRIFGKKDL